MFCWHSPIAESEDVVRFPQTRNARKGRHEPRNVLGRIRWAGTTASNLDRSCALKQNWTKRTQRSCCWLCDHVPNWEWSGIKEGLISEWPPGKAPTQPSLRLTVSLGAIWCAVLKTRGPSTLNPPARVLNSKSLCFRPHELVFGKHSSPMKIVKLENERNRVLLIGVFCAACHGRLLSRKNTTMKLLGDRGNSKMTPTGLWRWRVCRKRIRWCLGGLRGCWCAWRWRGRCVGHRQRSRRAELVDLCSWCEYVAETVTVV
jgi:hypothetical protein